MSGEMKLRARMIDDDVAEVTVLITHAMETGQRKDPATKNVVPAHFINQLTATLNGKATLVAQWGTGIARNPVLDFRIKGARPGDVVAISAVDNLGTRFEHKTIVT